MLLTFLTNPPISIDFGNLLFGGVIRKTGLQEGVLGKGGADFTYLSAT
jgi:hypothetical protein